MESDGNIKKKQKKPVKRKVKRDRKRDSKVMVESIDGIESLHIDEVRQSKSQPQSRRGSSIESPNFIISEITRGASDVNSADIANINNNKRNNNEKKVGDGVSENTRRGNTRVPDKNNAIDDLETRKLRSVLELMGMQKKTRTEFTWDTVDKTREEEKPKRSEIKPRAPVMMTSDKAMKTLGLQQTVAGAGGKISKTLRDYSEEDITQAFQSESLKLATQGKSSEMQTCHEAYQVLLKVIRAKNKFIRKAAAAREQLNNENRQSGNLEILNP